MKIALDAMGGDHAPAYPVEAAVRALELYPQIEELTLTGREDLLRAELVRHGTAPSPRLRILHCSEAVTMEDKAVDAVRRKKDSSLNRAVELVKDGRADAIISAGNTGALVASTTIKLRTLPGVDRAGIAALMPTGNGVFVLIDAGANVDSRPEHLVAYGIMGSIFCREILHRPSPRVGLLSNGTEEGKGNDLTRETHRLLRDAPIHYIGNIEGHSLFTGGADVVVCDGFVGNIVLKTAENLAKSTFAWLKAELTANPVRLLGAWLSRGAFRAIKKKTNADEYGGALLLGVNGIAIKAHGSSSVKALVNSIRVAVESIEHRVNERIVQDIARLAATPSAPPAQSAPASTP
jgi:glycerol-3-phosphate acyltransferase PlsX